MMSGDASKIVGVIQDITGYKQPDSTPKNQAQVPYTKKTSVRQGRRTSNGSADKKFEVLIQEANDVYVCPVP